MYYGFKEYFNRKKNSDKLEFYAQTSFGNLVDIRISGS